MQEFAGFYKISVDVRYWPIPSVRTGSNAGRCGQYRSSAQPAFQNKIPSSKGQDIRPSI